MSTPASAAMGMRLMTPDSRNMDASRPTEWMMPVRRVCCPALMATLVRAMAAVAGTPPKNGMTMLPTPWAISSRSALRGSPFMFPAEAPHSSDSIMPSAAMEKAGASRPVTLPSSMPPSDSRAAGSSVRGMAPTTATSHFRKALRMSTTMRDASDDGNTACHFFGQTIMNSTTNRPIAVVRQLGWKPFWK